MSVTTTDLWRLSATELAAAIRSRRRPASGLRGAGWVQLFGVVSVAIGAAIGTPIGKRIEQRLQRRATAFKAATPEHAA